MNDSDTVSGTGDLVRALRGYTWFAIFLLGIVTLVAYQSHS